jgi:hypothetical protein
MPEEKYTEEFLNSLSEDQLGELLASFPPDENGPESTQGELLARISAELERRNRDKAAPPPS